MGTTCTVLVLLPQGAMVAQVGDSRAYRLRGNRYEQLTFDHSLVWEMRAAANCPPAKSPTTSPRTSLPGRWGRIRRSRSTWKGRFPVLPGDTFLLCSDGLSGPVKDEEMGIILQCLPPAEAARTLVDLANLRGGPDNITVVIVRVKGPVDRGRRGPIACARRDARWPSPSIPRCGPSWESWW